MEDPPATDRGNSAESRGRALITVGQAKPLAHPAQDRCEQLHGRKLTTFADLEVHGGQFADPTARENEKGILKYK